MGEPATSLEYSRGLDGLRGLALFLMLWFHFELPFVRGGPVGVSLFFTLSGYLITQLLLAEHARNGRISLRQFWGRRLRRLLPASIVGLSAIAIAATTTEWFSPDRLRGDLLASLGYAANWRSAFSGQSYASAIAAVSGDVKPSPVLHFWSLAIEEQFYVAFPLLMVALLALRRRRLLWTVLVGLCVASGLSAVFTESDSINYYGTHTRAFEILAGVLLAGVLPLHRKVSSAARRVLGATGLLAVIGIVAAAVALKDGSAYIYDGGMITIVPLSVFAIAGVAANRRVGDLIGNPPLAWLGSISYGLYIYHWPVVLVLTPERTGFDGIGLAVLRAGLSVGLALVSLHVVEQPVRRRRWPQPGGQAFTAAVAGVCTACAVILAMPARTAEHGALAGVNAPSQPVQFGSAQRTSTGIDVASTEPFAPGDALDPPPSDPVRTVRVQLLDDRADVAAWLSASTVHGLRVDVDVSPELLSDTADLVVRVVDSRQRDELNAAVAGRTGDDLTIAAIKSSENIAAQIGASMGDGPGLIIEVGSSESLVTALESVDLADSGLELLVMPELDRRALTQTLERLIPVDDGGVGGSRRRVMVIGDSVSYGVAAALDATASDRWDVLWAGGQNCPIIEAYEVRWWDDVELRVDECPNVEPTWRDLAEQFRPDVVLIVVSVPEQSEQRYEPGGAWFVVGDDEFVTRHAHGFAELRNALAGSGTVTLLATSPAINNGSMAGAYFARPQRVLRWNAQMHDWANEYTDVGLVEMAEMIHAAETAAGTSLRPDAIHMSEAALNQLVERDLAPALFDAYHATVAEAVAGGCLIESGVLILERCNATRPTG